MSAQEVEDRIQRERKLVIFQTRCDVETGDNEEHADATDATHEDVPWEEADK